MQRTRKQHQLDPQGNPDYPEAETDIATRLPPATPFAASSMVPEVQNYSAEPDKDGWYTRNYQDEAPLVSVSKPPSTDVVNGTYLKRVPPLYGDRGPDMDLKETAFRRARPMGYREAAAAGLFEDNTPGNVNMDTADKVRVGFMRPFADKQREDGRNRMPGTKAVQRVLKRLNNARRMDDRQMDVRSGNAGEEFRRGLDESRSLRWGASGPTSVVNRAIDQRRQLKEQTDEAVRLNKALPVANAVKPMTAAQAANLMMRRATFFQGDGITPINDEARKEIERLDKYLSDSGYSATEQPRDVEQPRDAPKSYKEGDVRQIKGKSYRRDKSGKWVPVG